MHLALTDAAVQWCWFIAHMYEQQIPTGVAAVTQACCEPVLQSVTEQWGMHMALTGAAVQWCWFIAHMYKQQTSTGAIAVTQA